MQDSKIVSADAFIPVLKTVLKSFKSKISRIVFIVEEKDIYDRFFVVRSDEEDVSASLKSQASSYVGEALDKYYTLYQKLSPFVYQFIGINKEIVDTHMYVAKSLNLLVDAIFPSSFVFSKFVGIYDPFFFVFTGPEESTLVASEYGGVYYSGTFATNSEVGTKMSSLIHELSTFNRERPVKKVFYIGNDLSIDPSFEVKKLAAGDNIDLTEYIGFERLLIAYKVVVDGFSVWDTYYFNFRNFTGQIHEINTSLVATPSRSIVKFVAPSLVLASLVLGSYFLYNDYQNKAASIKPDNKPQVIGVSEQKPEDTSIKESSPSAVNTPAEKPAPDRKTVKIRVENGIGVSGTAGKMKDALEKLGYKVVEVGNASEFTHDATEISVKEGNKELYDLLKSDLEKTYTVKQGSDLSKDKTYDALVIVGKSK